MNGLVDLLARHLVGRRKPVFSVLAVPSEAAEDLRQLGRELKLVKRDRTRVSNRIKGLLANQGLLVERNQDMARQLASLRPRNGSKLPNHLGGRLVERPKNGSDHETVRSSYEPITSGPTLNTTHGWPAFDPWRCCGS